MNENQVCAAEQLSNWQRRSRCVQRVVRTLLSKAQKALAKKHGTPAEFAAAVYRAVPSEISMDEAAAAVSKYNREWAEAS